MPVIEAERISFSYHGTPVIRNISISAGSGKILALLGPNGSGKTTLLKIFLGLFRPDTGSVKIKGVSLSEMAPRVVAKHLAYVPQTHREAFGYSVFDVVLMGRMPHSSFFGGFSKKDRKIAGESLERLSIAHLSRRPYTEISGGERQLVLIARAVAQGAGTLVMDEPANGLDFGNQLRLLSHLRELAREGLTFIFTTHQPDHAILGADRVVMIKNGEIARDGSPEKTITPSNIMELYGLEDIYTDSAEIFCEYTARKVCA